MVHWAGRGTFFIHLNIIKTYFPAKLFFKYLKLNFDNLFKILVLYLISIGEKENVGFFRSN